MHDTLKKFFFILLLVAVHSAFGTAGQLATDRSADATSAAAYVGSSSCKLCHSAHYDAWHETRHARASFGCEACHGPGSAHVAAPSADTIITDRSSELCGRCHSRNNGTVIEAHSGCFKADQQYNQWRASPHWSVTPCTTCHDPHYSLATRQASAIKKSCTACHPGIKIFFGMQQVGCERCHMPHADARTTVSGVGPYRTGDRATHIWRIKPEATREELFSFNGTRAQFDSRGAYITVDVSCLGCHNGKDARLYDVESVKQTAPLVH